MKFVFAVLLLTGLVGLSNAQTGAQCGGIPLTYCGPTNINSYSASPPTLGAAGTTTTDPDFGTKSLRVTASGYCGETAGYSYSPNGGDGWHSSWSLDDSKVLIMSESNNYYYQGINTSTSPISLTGTCVQVKPAKFSYSPAFSHVTANKMYGFESDEQTLASWDTVAADGVVALKNFSTIPGATWGANAARIGEGDGNDAWFCYSNNGQEVGTQAVCWNQSTGNTQVLDLVAATSKQNSSAAVALDNLTTAQLAGCGIHELTMSPDGLWENVVMNNCTAFPVTGAPAGSGDMFWQLGTNHVTYLQAGFGTHDAMGFGGVYINGSADQPPCATYNAGWKMWPASNPGTAGSPNYVSINPCIASTQENQDGHLSWLNNKNDAHVNAYPIIFMSNGPPGSTNLNGYLEWEIDAIQTAPALSLLKAGSFGVAANGTIWRLGHTFNAPSPNQCAQMNYVSENVSPGGKYVLYTSDYQGGTGLNGDCTNGHRNDVFILDATTQGSGPPAPVPPTNLTVTVQ